MMKVSIGVCVWEDHPMKAGIGMFLFGKTIS